MRRFTGILEVNGYAGHNRLIAPDRVGPNIQLAYCWAHARRKLVEITRTGSAPIADEGLKRIGELYHRGRTARFRTSSTRRAAGTISAANRGHEGLADASSRPCRGQVAARRGALAYIAKYWDGLCVFLTDGRIEIDNNTVERTIRPIALNRKNALFARHDAGAENWATIASLIETCKLNAVDPFAYLSSTLTAIVNGHRQMHIDVLMPWNYSRRTNG
ncbi:hypothetical protein ABIA41_003464 [Bradyrhizobium sp. USDA 313]